jgi:hypothetical protein
MFGKILLVLGILGILLGVLVAIISLVLPQMTRNVSMDEAMIGVVIGGILLVLSFLPAILGIVLIVMGKKKAPPQA